MRRFLAFACFCMCLFSISVQAQTVPDMVQAPARAQGTWHSPSGRTTVTLDAEVIAPEVSGMPIVEVFPRIFEASTARDFADLMIGKDQWEAWYYSKTGSSAEETRDPDPEPDYHLFDSNPFGDFYSMMIAGKEVDARGYSLQKVNSNYTKLAGFTEILAYNYLEYAYAQCTHDGKNIGTPEEARALSDAVVAQMFPQMHYHSTDPQLDDLSERCLTVQPAGDYGYRLYYTRQIAGVPVTLVYQQGGSAILDEYSYAIPYEKLFVDVGEKGIFLMRYNNPLSVGETIVESPVLLPFNDILDIFTKVSPLKYASGESEKNNGIQINRIVLGYMHLQMKDHPNRYQMVPVWDFFGTRTIGKEMLNEFNWSYFTINAIDGTVIDRDLGY